MLCCTEAQRLRPCEQVSQGSQGNSQHMSSTCLQAARRLPAHQLASESPQRLCPSSGLSPCPSPACKHPARLSSGAPQWPLGLHVHACGWLGIRCDCATARHSGAPAAGACPGRAPFSSIHLTVILCLAMLHMALQSQTTGIGTKGSPPAGLDRAMGPQGTAQLLLGDGQRQAPHKDGGLQAAS